MNFFKKNHKLVGQNEQSEKKPHKHDVNLQKNSTLYFQVGLILTLLATYALFEMNFQVSIPNEKTLVTLEEPDVFTAETKKYVIYEEQAPKVEKKQIKPTIVIDPKIVEDDTPDVVAALVTEAPTVNVSEFDPDAMDDVIEIDEVAPVPFALVENVPVFPGCEKKKTNSEKKKCMEQKLAKHINRKFNTDLAIDLGLTGKQVIQTQFKIDKNGNVVDIKARAPHSRLEKEAAKVIGKIPQMIPGKQRDQSVEVIYSLPIVFKVQ